MYVHRRIRRRQRSGAVNIPLDILPGKLAEFKGKEHTVLFCRSGARSGMAKPSWKNNGLRGVINGGSWQNVQQYAKSWTR